MCARLFWQMSSRVADALQVGPSDVLSVIDGIASVSF